MSDLSAIEQEIYTHEYLWRSGSKLFEHAEKNKEGSFYFLLPSLLLSYMAFEAFINFCGFVILPKLWMDEKKNFKGSGIEGKLDEIVKELPDFDWKKGEAPYQNIKKVGNFRDIVSHGKVEASSFVAERKEDMSHMQLQASWDTYISVEEIKRARADIKSFCQSLLIELRKKEECDHSQLKYDAFEGPLAVAIGISAHDQR